MKNVLNILRKYALYGILCCFHLQGIATAQDIITEKPSYIETCKIYEPGFSKCSTRSIQKLMDQVVIGIPEVTKIFGPLEPMLLKKIVFKQDNNEAATISADITDLYLKGFSKMQIKESKVSKKDFSWQTRVFLPRLRMDGKYKMHGKILLLPLNGEGNIYLDIENLDILQYTKVRLYEKNGFTFYNVTEVRASFNMTNAKANLDNLFNGRNKEIEKSTNEFFNTNWRDFFEALRPLITETVEDVLLRLMRAIFDVLPAVFFVEDVPTSKQLYGTE